MATWDPCFWGEETDLWVVYEFLIWAPKCVRKGQAHLTNQIDAVHACTGENRCDRSCTKTSPVPNCGQITDVQREGGPCGLLLFVLVSPAVNPADTFVTAKQLLTWKHPPDTITHGIDW